jgi:hypothetical protein
MASLQERPGADALRRWTQFLQPQRPYVTSPAYVDSWISLGPPPFHNPSAATAWRNLLTVGTRLAAAMAYFSFLTRPMHVPGNRMLFETAFVTVNMLTLLQMLLN